LLVAATGDVHHPTYTDLLRSTIGSIGAPDVFLIAGDILKPGDPSEYSEVVSIIREHVGCPLIASFGNTEFREDRARIRSENPGVKFLDDEAISLDVNGSSVLVVGSTGSLERPTSWQKRNIPHISDIYRARVETVANLLHRKADVKMLLTHYASTYLTLEGESRSSYPWMGTRRFESVITEIRPSAVVHAHAHRGTSRANLDGIPVYNVSLPLNAGVASFELAE
jgi:Icc-related predicted phosphoesterase